MGIKGFFKTAFSKKQESEENKKETKPTEEGSSSYGTTRLKVLQVNTDLSGNKIALVAIEKGRITKLRKYESLRTGTQYRVDGNPFYLSEDIAKENGMEIEFFHSYYKQHPDFATNEQMQKYCRGEARLTQGPIYFMGVKFIPFKVEENTTERTDIPEKYDLEINDELASLL